MLMNSVSLLLITHDTIYLQIEVSMAAVSFLENFFRFFKSMKTVAMDSYCNSYINNSLILQIN
jgi:hypothetical protein